MDQLNHAGIAVVVLEIYAVQPSSYRVRCIDPELHDMGRDRTLGDALHPAIHDMAVDRSLDLKVTVGIGVLAGIQEIARQGRRRAAETAQRR